MPSFEALAGMNFIALALALISQVNERHAPLCQSLDLDLATSGPIASPFASSGSGSRKLHRDLQDELRELDKWPLLKKMTALLCRSEGELPSTTKGGKQHRNWRREEKGQTAQNRKYKKTSQRGLVVPRAVRSVLCCLPAVCLLFLPPPSTNFCGFYPPVVVLEPRPTS